MTSKLSVEVCAPKDGKIYKIFAPVDEVVPVGKVIAVLQLEGETLSEADVEKITDRYIPEANTFSAKEEETQVAGDNKTAESFTKPDQVKISPVAKKMADELGVDISKVKGTGPEGRIVKRYINLQGKSEV